MARYRVIYSPESEAQLASLYRYIAHHGSSSIALGLTDAIVARCDSLDEMPLQGRLRDDLRPGLRTLGFRRRVLIAYSVEDTTVTVLGIFHGGQDYETLLRED